MARVSPGGKRIYYDVDKEGRMDQAKEYDRLDSLFDDLFPIMRSITGPGFRRSLDRLGEDIPLNVEGVPSGTEVFD